MIEAAKLSAEWNNTGFIVLNEDKTLSATVWNHYKYEEPQRLCIATVNGNDGFKITKKQYCFEVPPVEVLNYDNKLL